MEPSRRPRGPPIDSWPILFFHFFLHRPVQCVQCPIKRQDRVLTRRETLLTLSEIKTRVANVLCFIAERERERECRKQHALDALFRIRMIDLPRPTTLHDPRSIIAAPRRAAGLAPPPPHFTHPRLKVSGHCCKVATYCKLCIRNATICKPL